MNGILKVIGLLMIIGTVGSLELDRLDLYRRYSRYYVDSWRGWYLNTESRLDDCAVN